MLDSTTVEILAVVLRQTFITALPTAPRVFVPLIQLTGTVSESRFPTSDGAVKPFCENPLSGFGTNPDVEVPENKRFKLPIRGAVEVRP